MGNIFFSHLIKITLNQIRSPLI